jgi:tRNA(Ile)-lysidine synthase
MTDLAERLRRHLRDADLFPDSGRALLAVSGGPDSVALLDLFAAVAPAFDLELVVAHVDHGIAPESGEVARQVARLAEHYGVPCRAVRLELGSDTSETRARRARYRALRELQREADGRYLVTAHHADDQTETVLYRLLRGTGMAGLAGIPARGARGLVRPLLPFRRRELETWLDEREVDAALRGAVHRDPANLDERHDRSWVRHRLLPLVRERFGSVAEKRLSDVARHASSERQAWAAALRTLPELELRVSGRVAEVARVPLARYDNTLSEALLRALAREVGCVLGPRRSARLLAFVCSSASGRVMQLGSSWVAELSFDRVRIAPDTHGAAHDEGAVTCGVEPEGRLKWNGWEVSWRQDTTGTLRRSSFVTWVTPGDNRVRSLASGDRIVPLGGVGRRRVRRLLMEARVPFRERDGYPVLVRSDEVLWVPGVCRSRNAVPRAGEPAMRIEARVAGDDDAG